MTGTATVTGKTGSGITVTAKAFTNLSMWEFDFNAQVLRLFTGGGQGGGTLQHDFGMDTFTTATLTIASGTFQLTIS